MAEGIVPGGGVALLQAEKALNKLKEFVGDEEAGVKIIRKILEYPLRYISENAGHDGAVVVNRVRNMKGKTEGFNADNGTYCDLVEAGVIRPSQSNQDRAAKRSQCRILAADNRVTCCRHSCRSRRRW